VLGVIKTDPGRVSLATMLSEIDKLRATRAVGLPPGLFTDVAPKVLTAWRARAAAESPSHLRGHPASTRLTLLAALVWRREHEITDTLVELLISVVHQRPGREAGDRGAGQRAQASPGQGEHPVPPGRSRRRASR